MSGDIQLTYMVGSAYSGSTLLCLLLDRIPSIATVGEMIGVDPTSRDQRCSCGRFIPYCPLWQELRLRLGASFDPLAPGTDFARWQRGPLSRASHSQLLWPSAENVREAFLRSVPPSRQRLRSISSRNVDFARAMLDIRRADLLLDASKSGMRLRRLLEIPDFSLSVLHLVRDSRGVVNSARKHRGMSIEASCRWWNRAQRYALSIRERYELPWLQVRYEDLVSATESEIDRIAAFLGRSRPEVSYGNYRDYEHHIIGNYMRFSKDREIRNDESWRTELTDTDQETVLRLTSRYRAELGY